jgi:hypothetical protein
VFSKKRACVAAKTVVKLPNSRLDFPVVVSLTGRDKKERIFEELRVLFLPVTMR